jgi:uncharacterized membrane protein required for colicin V production
MLFNVIKQFNWVDISIIILVLRICFTSYETGLPVTLFKLLGTLAALYLSMHYYTWLSDQLMRLPFARVFPLTFMDFVCFLVLMVLGYGIFIFLRIMVHRFLKMEAVPVLNKWGGLVLGIIRAVLVAGLFIFSLRISTAGYLMRSAVKSYSGTYLLHVAPSVYSWMWYGVASRFAVNEKFNSTVNEIERGLYN